jgi:uncharacterized protein
VIIRVHQVGQAGRRFDGAEEPDILELEGDRFVRGIEPVAYHLFAERIGPELIVRGTVSGAMELQCSRCAEFFSTSVADSSFLRAYGVPDGLEQVDVTPDIREAILLLLPAFPLCREECAGLCPQCGVNLNHTRCACVIHAGDARWGALDSWDLKKEKP